MNCCGAPVFCAKWPSESTHANAIASTGWRWTSKTQRANAALDASSDEGAIDNVMAALAKLAGVE